MDVQTWAGTGSVHPIVRWGHPVLHAPSHPVTVFDEQLHALIADMVATMQAAEGVGLAAPQIGVDLSVFVYDCPDAEHQHQHGVICNPMLELPEGRDRHLVEDAEGCLSLPGAHALLARPDVAICRGVDGHGNPVSVTGTGLLARCLQHETDHLRGTVFGDRLPSRVRSALLDEADGLAGNYPENWPVPD